MKGKLNAFKMQTHTHTQTHTDTHTHTHKHTHMHIRAISEVFFCLVCLEVGFFSFQVAKSLISAHFAVTVEK